MKIGRAAMILMSLGLCFSTGLAQENGNGWSSGVEFDFNSKYIWRALAWSEGAVWQPSFWIGKSGWTVTGWGNFVLTKEPNYRQFNEFDLRLAYETELGGFQMTPAINIYTYPNMNHEENPTTGEVELRIAYDLQDFTLETTLAIDFWKNFGGLMGEVAMEYEKEAVRGWFFDAAVRILYANSKFNTYYIDPDFTSAALLGLVLEAGTTVSFDIGLYIRPHVEYTTVMDTDLRTAVEASDWVSLRKGSLFNFGIAIGWEF